jgi:hypothetical protein
MRILECHSAGSLLVSVYTGSIISVVRIVKQFGLQEADPVT